MARTETETSLQAIRSEGEKLLENHGIPYTLPKNANIRQRLSYLAKWMGSPTKTFEQEVQLGDVSLVFKIDNRNTRIGSPGGEPHLNMSLNFFELRFDQFSPNGRFFLDRHPAGTKDYKAGIFKKALNEAKEKVEPAFP